MKFLSGRQPWWWAILHGDFHEPETDLTVRKFLAGLGGHIGTYLASK
jgi:hypothetical protein